MHSSWGQILLFSFLHPPSAFNVSTQHVTFGGQTTWKIDRRKTGVGGEVLNRSQAYTEEMSKRFTQLVDDELQSANLGRQRLGRVYTGRKNTTYRSSTLLMWVYEQGFDIREEIGEFTKGPARPPLSLSCGRLLVHVGSLYRECVIYTTVVSQAWKRSSTYWNKFLIHEQNKDCSIQYLQKMQAVISDYLFLPATNTLSRLHQPKQKPSVCSQLLDIFCISNLN